MSLCKRGEYIVTVAFELMMYLFKCAVMSVEPKIDKELNLSDIYEVSKQQGIWPLVFLSVQKLYEKKLMQGKPELMGALQQQILVSITKGATRKEILKIILDELRAKNITVVLLKGDILADLYPFPDYRLSGDIDLLVKPGDEKVIFKVFEKYGFEVEARMNKEHHSVCRHPAAGVVELHVALHDDYCEEIWFAGKTQIDEDFTDFTTKDGYQYEVLGLNDCFIYLTTHMIKHFLSGGAGMRQIMDILLFIRKYKDEIDFERYKKLMIELSFENFMDCCMDIGVNYLGFTADDLFYITGAKQSKKRIDAVLDDIEKCGLFGHKDADLRDFKMVYLEKRYARLRGGEVKEYLEHRLNIVQKLQLIFMRRDILERKYPYVKKSFLLVPIAWFHRIIKFVLKREELKEEELYPKQKQTTYEQRVNLLEELKMI